MKRALNFLLRLAVIGPLFLTASSSKVYGETTDKTIASRTAEIDGVKVHYMTEGHGTPLILLHGYAETSLMWKPIIPALAERFTVIAPDLPGIGDSDIPADGLDMKSAAIRIHDLARSLGVPKSSRIILPVFSSDYHRHSGGLSATRCVGRSGEGCIRKLLSIVLKSTKNSRLYFLYLPLCVHLSTSQ